MPRDTTVRQRVTDYLVGHGEVSDRSGRATSRLKEAVGYNGGDAGFIRIVSLMAEAGDIEREVRGKRTYRITLTDQGRATAAHHVTAATSLTPMARSEAATHDGELDYDELAAALLSRAARALSAVETASSNGDQAAWARRRLDQLEAKVVALQRDLARARAEVQAVTDERDELRAQLEMSARNLDVLTERLGQRQPAVPRAAERLDSDEQALLRSLRHPQRPADSSTRAG